MEDLYTRYHDTTIINDTITDRISLSSLPEGLNAMPSRLPLKESSLTLYYLQQSGIKGKLMKTPPDSWGITTDDDSCYQGVAYSGNGFMAEYYIDGLGYYYNADYSIYQNHQILLYYKKGTEIYGNPVDFDKYLTVSTGKEEISFNVSPNPFTESATIKINNPSGNNYRLVLYNTFGQKVQEYSFRGDHITIYNDGSLKGLYVYKLFSDMNEAGTGKLFAY